MKNEFELYDEKGNILVSYEESKEKVIHMFYSKMNYKTIIVEFEVIEPTDHFESIGEKLMLSMGGEYCPVNSLRGYELGELLLMRENYRPTKLLQQGVLIEIKYHHKNE